MEMIVIDANQGMDLIVLDNVSNINLEYFYDISQAKEHEMNECDWQAWSPERPWRLYVWYTNKDHMIRWLDDAVATQLFRRINTWGDYR